MYRPNHHVLFLTIDRINQLYCAESNGYRYYKMQSLPQSIVLQIRSYEFIFTFRLEMKILKKLTAVQLFFRCHPKSLGHVH